MYSLMGLSKRLYPAGRREEGMEHFTPARFSSGLPTMTPYPGNHSSASCLHRGASSSNATVHALLFVLRGLCVGSPTWLPEILGLCSPEQRAPL